MNCERYRDGVSALLDGEEPGVATDLLRRHLELCPDCRRWRDATAALARSVRLAPAEDVPDLTGEILLAAASRMGGGPAPRSTSPRWRVGLALVAVAQLALGVADLAGGGGTASHSLRELGSWDLALAIGFLVAAWRPARAWGMVPLVAAVVGCLVLSSGVDLFSGRVQPAREAAHALEAAGLALLWILARTYNGHGGTPSAARSDQGWSVARALGTLGSGRERGVPPAALGRRAA